MCKYVCQNISFKYKIQYKIQFFWLSHFRDRLQICKSKPWLYHTTTNNYDWFTDPKFCMQCIGIFQRWWTKADLSLAECTMWYSQWHLVDAWNSISNHENSSILGYWKISRSKYKAKFISMSNHFFNKLRVAHTVHNSKMKMILLFPNT